MITFKQRLRACEIPPDYRMTKMQKLRERFVVRMNQLSLLLNYPQELTKKQIDLACTLRARLTEQYTARRLQESLALLETERLVRELS